MKPLSVFKGWASDGPPAELNIMAQSTSIQRVQRLIDSVPLTNLLFTLLSTSYKKVCDHKTRSWLLCGSGLLCLMHVVALVVLHSGMCAAATEEGFSQQ